MSTLTGIPNEEEQLPTILPCPHCGLGLPTTCCATDQEINGDSGSNNYFAVVCDCTAHPKGCGAAGGMSSSRLEAINKWNRRADGTDNPD